MLTCKQCGSLLISNGEEWFCPRRSMPYAHSDKGIGSSTSFPDRRKGVQKGQSNATSNPR